MTRAILVNLCGLANLALAKARQWPYPRPAGGQPFWLALSSGWLALQPASFGVAG